MRLVRSKNRLSFGGSLRAAGFIFILACSFVATSASAQSDEVTYQRHSGRRALRLRNCSLFDGATSAVITRRRNRVRLPGRQFRNRKSERLGSRYSYFGCLASGDASMNDILYAKRAEGDEAATFLFDDTENFEEKSGGSNSGGQGLSAVCAKTRERLGSEIWKTLGSNHFSASDCRRTTAGWIVAHGGPSVSSCINVYDREGNLVTKMGGYFPAGSDWKSRNYSCWGCGSGSGMSGGTIASRARSKTGSSEVYLQTGNNTCVRIPNAGQCYGSSQC